MTEATMAPTFKGVLVRGAYYVGEWAMLVCCATQPGQSFLLERQRNNGFDQNAIKVLLDGGELAGGKIGYIQRDVAFELAPWMDRGWVYTCVCTGKKCGGITKCNPIVTLTPIAPIQKKQETDTKAPTPKTPVKEDA